MTGVFNLPHELTSQTEYLVHMRTCRLSMSKMGAKRAARKRQRKALPFAWGVLGEGGDFDQVRA